MRANLMGSCVLLFLLVGLLPNCRQRTTSTDADQGMTETEPATKGEAADAARLSEQPTTRPDANQKEAEVKEATTGEPNGAAENRASTGHRVDFYGDLLPARALARIGTVRLPDGGGASHVAFSPDGEFLASCKGAGSGEAALWETATGKRIRIFKLPGPASISSVAFSHDGTTLALAGDRVRLYDVPSGQKLRELDGKTFAFFLPDGRGLVSRAKDYRGISLWDAASGERLRSVPGLVDGTRSLAVSLDGKILVVSGANKMHVLDLAAGKVIIKINRPERAITCIALSPDGRLLASADEYRTVRLWDVATGKQVRSLDGHERQISSLSFSPDGKTLASAGFDDKTVRLWDVATGAKKLLLWGHRNSVRAVAFSPDGKTLASGGGRTIRLWNIATGAELTPQVGGGPIESIAFSPDGKAIATAHKDDKTVRLWETMTGKELSRFHGHADTVSSVAFSPDAEKLASGSWDGTVRLWDVASRRQTQQVEGCTVSSRGVAFSPNGRKLAAAGSKRRPRLWDVATGKRLLDFGERRLSVRALAFSPKGEFVAGAGGRDRTVRLWSVVTGAEIARFVAPGRKAELWCVAFSHDGKRIAAAGYDSMIRIWDVAHGEHIHPEEGRTNHIGIIIIRADGTGKDVRRGRPFEVQYGHINGIAFSPDGRMLASGSSDRMVRLWDAETGEELAALQGHSSSVEAVAFSPDGALLASGSSDGTALVWNLRALPRETSDDF